MTIEFYRDFFTHDHWANLRVIESVRGMESLERPLKFLSHILAAQEVWMTRIEGGDYRSLTTWPMWTLEECAGRAEVLRDRWAELLERMGDEGLGRVVEYTTFAGVDCRSTVRDILTHVNNHSTYHRAQIATSVKEAGGKPAATDFIAYTLAVR